MLKSVILKLCLISCIFLMTAFDASADSYFYHPQTMLHLGSNFDPLNLTRVYPPCIANGAEEPVDGVNSTPVSSDLHFAIKQVHSKRELYSLIKMSASMSGQYAMFSADAAASSEAESQSSTEALSWVLMITSDFGRFRAKDPQLTSDARQLAQSDLTKFVERCGTEVVLQVTRGVSLAVVFAANASSEQERESLNASLNASFGGDLWGVSASGQFSSDVQRAIQNGEITIDVVGSGGDGATGLAGLISDLKDLQSLDAIKQRLATYAATLTAQKTAITQYQTGSMSSLVPDLRTVDFALYNWMISEYYFALQENIAWLTKIRNFLADSSDYDATVPQIGKAQEHLNLLRSRIFEISTVARSCRQKYESVISTLAQAAPRGRGSRRGAGNQDKIVAAANQSLLTDLASTKANASVPLVSLTGADGDPGKTLVALVPAVKQDACKFKATWLDFEGFGDFPNYPFDTPVIWNDPLNASPANFLYARVTGTSVVNARLVDLDSDHDILVLPKKASGQFEGMWDMTLAPAVHRIDLVVTTKTGRTFNVQALR